MKLTVSFPVEKVYVPAGYTFRGAIVEAEVVRILRSPARHDKSYHPWRVTGWHYSADVTHPDLAPEAVRLGPDDECRASISRKLNPKWKPPEFPAGANWVAA